jgi:uncharacterized protein (DUF1810 family)
MGTDLEGFVEAQSGVFEGAVDELRRGRKVGHWIWFIFPQLVGLGRSPTSQRYALRSLAEARAYLAHPLLGPRLRECAEVLLAAPQGRSAIDIFGELDALKVRSSMTLFHRAAPEERLLRAVLDRFYDGRPDERTDELLNRP